jgi:hypothetical protein
MGIVSGKEEGLMRRLQERELEIKQLRIEM